MAKTVQSRKSKGRNFQKYVRDELLKRASHLEPDDIISTSMGSAGEDLKLSPAARKVYPFAWECKAQESLQIWAALQQAEENKGKHIPVLAFKRNHSDAYVALKLEDFLNLIRPMAKIEQIHKEILETHSETFKRLATK